MKTWLLGGVVVLSVIFLPLNGFPATYNLTGQLTVTASKHWNNCGVGNPGTEGSTVILIQRGDRISIFDMNEGFQIEGSVSGAQYTILTDYCQEVDGDDVCVPETCTLTATSNTEASGTCNWNYAGQCSGGYTVSITRQPQSPATYDANGLWMYYEQPDQWNNCGRPNPDPTSGTLTVTQTGNMITAFDSRGAQFEGFASGSTYTMVTSYPENGGTVSVFQTTTLGNGGFSGSGSCQWIWYDQFDNTCSGGFSVVVARAWTITASAGAGGTISPSGSVLVPQNGGQAFTATPNRGYRLQDVRVDGVSVGAPETYTFSNVQSAHSIQALFKKSGGMPWAQLLLDD
jgi:hypothetical protein